MLVWRPILFLVAVFLLGYLACSCLSSPGQLFTSSSGYSSGYGGYGGYGGGAPYRTWGQPAYAVSAPYPRQIMRPPPPPPCYSPCDY